MYRCGTCNRKVNRITPTKVKDRWVELCMGCLQEHELQTRGENIVEQNTKG